MGYKITFQQFDELQLLTNHLLKIYVAMPEELDKYSDLLMVEIKRLSKVQNAILGIESEEVSNE